MTSPDAWTTEREEIRRGHAGLLATGANSLTRRAAHSMVVGRYDLGEKFSRQGVTVASWIYRHFRSGENIQDYTITVACRSTGDFAGIWIPTSCECMSHKTEAGCELWQIGEEKLKQCKHCRLLYWRLNETEEWQELTRLILETARWTDAQWKEVLKLIRAEDRRAAMSEEQRRRADEKALRRRMVREAQEQAKNKVAARRIERTPDGGMMIEYEDGRKVTI